MRNSAITNIQANYTQHPYTAQTAGHVYAYTYREHRKHVYTGTQTHGDIQRHGYIQTRVLRLLPPSFARVLKSQFSDFATRQHTR